MFLVFWTKRRDFNWKSVLIDSVVDIVMSVCLVLAVFSWVRGTSPVSLDMLRVTSVVLLASTGAVTVRAFQSGGLTSAHFVDLVGVLALVGVLVYFTRSIHPAPNELLMAVYLNGFVGLLIWGKIVLHKLRRASGFDFERVQPLQPDAIHDKDGPGYKGPGTPGGPGQDQKMPDERKFTGNFRPQPQSQPATE